MALGATLYRFHVTLSDVDRNCYEVLDLRVARHPSETARYLLTRTLAYCLAYAPGIAFSKGGLSASEEPALSITAEDGTLDAWIDVGSPSAERLHRASKAARRTLVFTYAEPSALRREAGSRSIYRVDSIEVQRIEPALLDWLEERLERTLEFELVRNSGRLYVTVGDARAEGEIENIALSPA